MAGEGERWTDKRKEEYVNMKRKQGTEELTDKWRKCRREREKTRVRT